MTEAEQKELGDLFGPADPEGSHDALVNAAECYLEYRAAKEEAEKKLKAASLALDQAEATLLGKMAEARVTSLKLDGVLLSAAVSCHYSLPAGALDDATVLRWLLRSGGHDLVKRTIHHQSFSGFCRELAAQEKTIPPFVKVCERRGVQVRRK